MGVNRDKLEFDSYLSEGYGSWGKALNCFLSAVTNHVTDFHRFTLLFRVAARQQKRTEHQE